jgi:hypothetical protein
VFAVEEVTTTGPGMGRPTTKEPAWIPEPATADETLLIISCAEVAVMLGPDVTVAVVVGAYKLIGDPALNSKLEVAEFEKLMAILENDCGYWVGVALTVTLETDWTTPHVFASGISAFETRSPGKIGPEVLDTTKLAVLGAFAITETVERTFAVA